MIGIEFHGQFGNQLFQYAAASVQAKRLGTSVRIVPRPLATRQALARLTLRHFAPEIELAFGHVDSGRLGRLRSPRFRHRFSPGTDCSDVESYDDAIWDIDDFTVLSGYFQSERYFTGYETHVRALFAEPDHLGKKIDGLAARTSLDFYNAVAVHIRLGDYRNQTHLIAGSEPGWCLPARYYHAALDLFPSRQIVLFTDDRVGAVEMLPRQPAHVFSSDDFLVDFYLMSRFRHKIIANSSYSWWSA